MNKMAWERRFQSPWGQLRGCPDSRQERKWPRALLGTSGIFTSQAGWLQLCHPPLPHQPHNWIQMVIPVLGQCVLGEGQLQTLSVLFPPSTGGASSRPLLRCSEPARQLVSGGDFPSVCRGGGKGTGKGRSRRALPQVRVARCCERRDGRGKMQRETSLGERPKVRVGVASPWVVGPRAPASTSA